MLKLRFSARCSEDGKTFIPGVSKVEKQASPATNLPVPTSGYGDYATNVTSDARIVPIAAFTPSLMKLSDGIFQDWMPLAPRS